MLKSEEILSILCIRIDTYPADACFEGLIGTYSEDRKTVCIMLEDNTTEEDRNALRNCAITLEQLKEIALTVNTLITDYAIDVHSHTLKTCKTFKKFTIQKTCIQAA